MTVPTTAMVLAAGFGLRMRPITATTPKPLVEVQGRTLIERVIDRLADAGVETVVVNTHHLGKQIEERLKGRQTPAIVFSPEPEILETGGGVNKALPLLGPDPFFVCNADTLWLNGPTSALGRLAEQWIDADMDALLLLQETVEAYGYDGLGDFVPDPFGRLVRRPEGEVSPYLFTGVQLLHPRLFAGAPNGPFSINRLYDRAIDRGRLYGIVHDGEWFHVGTPDGLREAEEYMQLRYAGNRRR